MAGRVGTPVAATWLPLAIAAAVIAAGCVGSNEPEVGVQEAAIVDGARDLAAPVDGVFHDSPRQWHRDATVQIEPGRCTGVLVAPNLVLTAAHCVRNIPTAVRFGIQADAPTPTNPDAMIPLPAGTPSTYDASVIACITHPTSGIGCNDGSVDTGTVANDVAVLVLDQRIDHGEHGTRTQTYHAIPAEIVRADPACPFSAGVRSNVCWTGTEVMHVGYGPTSGCVNPRDPATFSRPAVRQARQQTVYIAQWVTGRESQFLLANLHGLPGDSGGPIYSMYEPYDDSRPLLVFGIHSASYTPLATSVCLPGPVAGDHHDIGTRLTDNGVQLFLETVLGIVRGGEFGVEVIDYPGIMAPITGTSSFRGGVWATTSAIPAGFTVWTGDLDLPPATEPEERAAFGTSTGTDLDTIDPDGDGLVGAHDNCWGYPNMEQHLSDATRICCMNDGGSTELATTFRDACVEACPQPATFSDPAIDCDGDLLPDVCEVDTDRDSIPDDCDNCVDAPNLDQADCNQDAILSLNERERAMGIALTPTRGDVCDPDPCGETRVIEASSETSGARLLVRDVAFDLFQVDARATAATRARTGYRFCQCALSGGDQLVDTPLARQRCALPGTMFNRGCQLSDLAAYDAPAEHRPWRWISVTPTASGGAAHPPGTEDDLAYATPRPGSFAVDREGRWRLLTDDMPRWETLDGISETFSPFTTADGLAGAISGVVWTHTPGPTSALGLYYTEAKRRRTSHYWSEEVPRPYRSIPFLPRFTLTTPIARRWDWHGTLPFIAHVPAFRGEPAGPMMIRGSFGVPRTSETALFEYPGTWVAASEPGALLPEDGLRHVALDADGGVAVVVAEFGGTLLDADAACPPQQPCSGGRLLLSGRFGEGRPAGALFPALDTSTPGVFVLSSRRQQLWRVASASDSSLASVATFDATTEQWAVRSVTGIGRVLAAVYSPRENVIWVLDEEPAAGAGAHRSVRHARLVALRPDSGRATVIATWRRHTSHDRFAMALDPAGRLYIAGSHHAAHAIVLVDPSLEGVVVVGARAGVGAIVPGMIRANAANVVVATDFAGRQTATEYSAGALTRGDMSWCL